MWELRKIGDGVKTRSRVQLTNCLVSPTSSTKGAPLPQSPPHYSFLPTWPPPSLQRKTREMSWISTDMSNADATGNSEMSYTSSLQYLNSQLVAHGFAHNPGISLDGLSTVNMESAVKVLLSLLNQRVVRCFLFCSPRFGGVRVG